MLATWRLKWDSQLHDERMQQSNPDGVQDLAQLGGGSNPLEIMQVIKF